MSKKILGILGILGGLGLAALVLYLYVAKEGPLKPIPSSPPEPAQEAASPPPEPLTKPAAPASQPAVPSEPTPPLSGPIAPPAVVPVPTPEPPPPPEKTVAPSPPPEPKEEHGVLVGRFRDYKKAQKLLAKIQKQKMPAFIRKEGKYYKVWAGPFPTSEEAAQAQKKLRAALKVTPKAGKLTLPGPK